MKNNSYKDKWYVFLLLYVLYPIQNDEWIPPIPPASVQNFLSIS